MFCWWGGFLFIKKAIYISQLFLYKYKKTQTIIHKEEYIEREKNMANEINLSTSTAASSANQNLKKASEALDKEDALLEFPNKDVNEFTGEDIYSIYEGEADGNYYEAMNFKEQKAALEEAGIDISDYTFDYAKDEEGNVYGFFSKADENGNTEYIKVVDDKEESEDISKKIIHTTVEEGETVGETEVYDQEQLAHNYKVGEENPTTPTTDPTSPTTDPTTDPDDSVTDPTAPTTSPTDGSDDGSEDPSPTITLPGGINITINIDGDNNGTIEFNA